MNQDFTVQKKSNICLKKKKLCRGLHLKKNSCTSSERKKKSCKLKIPPPPPHHFSNGPSLVTELTVVRCVNLMEMS